jgi:anaerobic selenocysteine-containing dehydrogenase
VCALDVEVLSDQRIGRVYGAKDHDYTDGVICAKVSRYKERIHHADRLTQPLLRVNAKTDIEPDFEIISWEKALDIIVQRFTDLAHTHGTESIWPYHYAGTMGLVQRDGLDLFRHAYRTTKQKCTICTTLADAGFVAGHGTKRGADPRRMQQSDLIVVWGGNPVNTQVNVMNHIAKAKRHRNARLVVVDPYRTRTAEKADLHLCLKPGTDGALACAVMHVLFRDDYADRAYLEKYTKDSEALEQHVQSRSPEWASAITGLAVLEIEQFAQWYGQTDNSFIRLGYGFSRSRNGAVNMHAASCLPAITGAWQYPGGGALYGQSQIYHLDKTVIEGKDVNDPSIRTIDMSRIGPALNGCEQDLQGGPPIKALLIQNTNPAIVAPQSADVKKGLLREDLFTVVHEQFMTDTAKLADLVLPATMFLEHDDIYTASGHTHLQIGRKLIEAPGECRSNHWLLQQLALRLGLSHPGFELSEWELIDDMLERSGWPDAQTVHEQGGIDCAQSFEDMNYLNGFGTPDKRFHFSPDWAAIGPNSAGMPSLPDHWEVIDAASEECPLRLVAAPARQFLNTSFTETATSKKMEKQPVAWMHPDDMTTYQVMDDSWVALGNQHGEVVLKAQAFAGVQVGTVIVESIWPSEHFKGGAGINTLISADAGQPNGGAVFHDTAIWARPHS